MSGNNHSKIIITKADIIWSYVAQFFNMGAGIIILPVILKTLPQDVLGIWYIFLTIGTFVALLDFGFQSAFTRNVAYAFGGATTLLKEGIDPSAPVMDRPNYALLKSIIKGMKLFYGAVSLVILGLLTVLGSIYILHISSSLENSDDILTAWFIYSVAVSIEFFYLYYNSLLLGRGLIKENNILIIITKSVYIAVTVIGLMLGYGIISVSIATCLSVIVNRIFAHRFFFKNGLKTLLRESSYYSQNILPIIRYNASKVGLAELAIFFTTRGNIFFASLFLPLSVVGQYGLTMQLILFVSRISQLYFQTHMPLFTQFQIENRKNDIRKIFSESVFIMTFTYLSVALIIVLFGNRILELIHSQTYFLPTLPLVLLFVVYYLDVNHVLPLLLLTTKNRIPYLYASLFSGFSIALLSPLFMGVFHWGIYGIILATGMVQLVYHNWKWPLVVSRDLGVSYLQIYKIGYNSLLQKCRNISGQSA